MAGTTVPVHSGTPQRSDVVGGPDYRNDESATDPNVPDVPAQHGQDQALVDPEKSPFADLTVEEFNKKNDIKPETQKEAAPAKREETPSSVARDDLSHGFGKPSTFPSTSGNKNRK